MPRFGLLHIVIAPRTGRSRIEVLENKQTNPTKTFWKDCGLHFAEIYVVI